MTQTQVNGIQVEYEIAGPQSGEAMLLIMGLGAQLTAWPPALRQGLIDAGYRVICYDSRDCGLSSRMTGYPDFDRIEAALQAGEVPPVPYSLDDMVRDAVGLLDVLGVERTHILGVSMGGMIGQVLAADYPHRVLSLTTMMTPAEVAKPDASTMQAMIAPLAPGVTLESLVEGATAFLQSLFSPAYPPSPEQIRARILADYQRAYYPEGFVRQTAAAYSNKRHGKFARIKVPTLILHGEADPIAPVSGARMMAQSIPGARLHTVSGWAHDIPAQLLPMFVEEITRNAALGSRAARAGS